jgi:hypothetical protein
MWKKAEERPSSAVFKDSKGISVDRDGGRSENEVCRFIVQRKSDLFAVIGLSAGECRALQTLQTYPVSKPIFEENPFHAEIHDSPTKVTLTDSKATSLARNFRVIRKY